MALVLIYGIRSAVKVVFFQPWTGHTDFNARIWTLCIHWWRLFEFFSHSLPQKQHPFSRRGAGCSQLSSVGSPLRTVETSIARVSSFLALDCEEMTLASSFHSICCWTVFPSPPTSTGKWLCLHFKRTGFNAVSPPQLWVLRLCHKQLLLPLHSSCNSSFTCACSYLQLMVWDLKQSRSGAAWDERQAGEGVGSVLVIGSTLGCHNLLYF